MTDTVKCEPPEGLRGVDGFHWVQPPQSSEPRVRRWRWTWGLWQDGAAETTLAGYAYIEPVLTPTEVAALRAERDAAWNEVEREREKYKDDMHAALVEVARWSQRSGLQDAELTTLRAEVEKLKRALKAADQFITNGIELGFIRMPDPSTPDPALETPGIIRAALKETAP